MDNAEIKELISWVFGVFAVSIVSLITGIYAIIKSGKMMPKELKGADLNNRSKEVSIADQLDELATRAADKAIKTQERLDSMEAHYCQLKEEHSALKDKVDGQELIINEQADIIKGQAERLDLQERKIIAQEEEISLLRCELNNSRLYNSALIQQMKEQNIIPIEGSTLPVEDCSKLKKYKKKKGNENVE